MADLLLFSLVAVTALATLLVKIHQRGRAASDERNDT